MCHKKYILYIIVETRYVLVYFVVEANHMKGGILMNLKAKAKDIVVSATNKMLKQNANSTGCVYIYQPKAPKALSRFSKIKNDK